MRQTSVLSSNDTTRYGRLTCAQSKAKEMASLI